MCAGSCIQSAGSLPVEFIHSNSGRCWYEFNWSDEITGGNTLVKSCFGCPNVGRCFLSSPWSLVGIAAVGWASCWGLIATPLCVLSTWCLPINLLQLALCFLRGGGQWLFACLAYLPQWGGAWGLEFLFFLCGHQGPPCGDYDTGMKLEFYANYFNKLRNSLPRVTFFHHIVSFCLWWPIKYF